MISISRAITWLRTNLTQAYNWLKVQSGKVWTWTWPYLKEIAPLILKEVISAWLKNKLK